MSIRVLVVDDSRLIRDVLSSLLVRDGDIEVCGTAAEPNEARQKIKALNPDVLTLDVEMPGMNGLAFLERLMRLHPMPVVMVSTLTRKGADETLLALELGAVDFVAKPDATLSNGLERFGAALRDKLRAAATVRSLRAPDGEAGGGIRNAPSAAGPEGSVIAIGASTGGVDAIRMVLSGLAADCAPVLITQHMPAGFTARFAARLDELCPMRVVEAEDGMVLAPGHAYVAPGDSHLRIRGAQGRLRTALGQDAAISGHRPSVDALFQSVAETVGPMALGVILTGMGRDGARGLLAMREAGAHTIGQSPESALVYGMPRVAFEEGAVIEQAPMEAIGLRLVQALSRLRRAA
ncbi:two-component system, chemotaxis family, response regulator CheB [Devosia enhydra]|uniref:Protein-glutamate methylesterase/protein-glutamine glutaminase n=1 Tax=Devosia enhydra TaxID=665118 RepID=A0A1K2HZQ5_9HYPH|nr:chemotaxis response regulator protein-glutamate methylesterase [Devosia enhydra]SFZ85614.1 two-component system, chemotaxis family, response regulator CheB [Devosia enhydra]